EQGDRSIKVKWISDGFPQERYATHSQCTRESGMIRMICRKQGRIKVPGLLLWLRVGGE
ncbi:hypothetical protein EJB05_26559, partial [Eragrostis curvula]